MPPMKAYFILALLLLGGLGLQAQSTTQAVIGNAGGESSHKEAQLTWTLGEFAIATFTDPQATLTQGHHQTNVVITEVEDAFPDTWEVNAYPNPVSEVLHVRWNATTQPVQLRFSNLSGQVLHQSKVEDAHATEFRVTDYPQGIYILEVFDINGTQGKTFKVEVLQH